MIRLLPPGYRCRSGPSRERRVDAASDGSEEAGWSLVVELEECLQLLSLLAAWYLECRVTANLEVDYLVVGILNVPDNVEFVAGKAIGNGEVEVVRIVLEGLLVVDEAKVRRSPVLPTSLKSTSLPKP